MIFPWFFCKGDSVCLPWGTNNFVPFFRWTRAVRELWPYYSSNYMHSYQCYFHWHFAVFCNSATLGAFAKLQTVTISFVMSVCPSLPLSTWNNSAPTDWIFMEFGILVFLLTCHKNSNFIKSDNTMYFTWRSIHIFIISCSIILRMQNVSDRCCRVNQNTYFMFSNVLLKIVPFMR